MNIYTILQYANSLNSSINGYGQKIVSENINSTHTDSATWCSEKIIKSNDPPLFPYENCADFNNYNYFIRKKTVKAENAKLAIEKFLKWEAYGLDESFLME